MLCPGYSTPRRHERVAVCVPVFLSGNELGKEFFEFGETINLSSGGALVALRRFVAADVALTIEIPSFHFADIAEKMGSSRKFCGHVVHRSTSVDYHLIGIQFDPDV